MRALLNSQSLAQCERERLAALPQGERESTERSKSFSPKVSQRIGLRGEAGYFFTDAIARRSIFS